jgi:hypothetical protein
MHDYFLSYRSSDLAAARKAKERLENAGRVVWLDEDPEEGLVGVPVGQDHWKTIQRAIDGAGALIVFDTPAWHESEYCRNELRYAVENGKRIAVLTADPDDRHPGLRDLPTGPADAPERLIGLLEPGDHLATVHARLLSELHGSATERHRRILLGQRDQARDALALSTAPGTEHGPYLTGELSAYCASVLANAARRRRRLISAGAAALVVLSGLTVVAAASGVTAQSRSAQARRSADHARSLTLAREASETGNSADALHNAERAFALEANDVTVGALTTIRNELSSRATLRVPNVPVFGWAVNNTGTVVLGSRDRSVVVGYPGTGRTVVIPSAQELGRRVAVAADGRTGFVAGRTGTLWCVDIAAERIEDSGVTGVVDLNVQPDGTLWWMSSSGALGHAASCPDPSSPTAATGLHDVTAFDLSPTRDRAYALTRSAQLKTVDLDSNRVRTVDLLTIPSSDRHKPREPRSITGASYVVRCDTRVHVLTGVDSSGGLSRSTWAGFSLDGAPLGGRVTNVTMVGLGCGPRADAWAAPFITPRALPLPRTAPYPMDEIDGRDASGYTVIGNSPDRSHSVVAHSDGRVGVLDVAKTVWGESAGTAAVALPVDGGTITVDTDGTARFRDGAGVARLGKLPGQPSPLSLTAGKSAIVATRGRITEIDRHRVVRSMPLPGSVTSMTLSRAGDEVVVGGAGWLLGIPLDPTKPARTLRLPVLNSGEKAMSIQSDSDRLLVATSYGRVLITTPTGTILHTADLGAAGATIAVFRADRGVNAAGGTGLLHSYTPDLRPITSLLLGVGAIFARPDLTGTTLVVAFSDYSVWTVDAVTLQPRSRITVRSPDVRLIVPSPDGTRMVVLRPPAGGAEAQLTTVPQGL